MDDLRNNKIAAAILATALGFMLIKELPHQLMHVEAPKVPVYMVGEIQKDGAGAVEEDLPFPQPTFIEAMDAERGAKVFKKCTSCHNVDKGGANGTGPNLHNIVGVAAAGKAGFKYSGAMANAGVTWDYESLDAFLTKPSKYISGTGMQFVGLKKEADRAAVIEYLRVASDNPVARPAAAAAPVEEVAPETEQGVVETIQTETQELIDNAPELTNPVEKVKEVVEQ